MFQPPATEMSLWPHVIVQREASYRKRCQVQLAICKKFKKKTFVKYNNTLTSQEFDTLCISLYANT